jgi:hypothetical protein
MNIVCVHLGLSRALAELGHKVLDLRPPAGPVRLAPMLAGFIPDLVIQQETLGPRTLLADLPDLDCPKIFWSIDTHLNSFWHQYYARLFDLFCTTQQHWLPWFAARGIASALWLPWHGTSRACAPWQDRAEGMTFVGRISSERPVREWFVSWLRELGEVRVRQDLGQAAMLDLYDRSRIVPNESIFGEVNFRLFEAASCGCAVLNPAVPGVEELFVPGQEVALYRDGAELAAWVGRLRADDGLARSLGLGAWERVCREHLPVHRAGALVSAAAGLSGAGAKGSTADVAWWLTLFQLREVGRLPMDDAVMEAGLLGLPLTEEVLAALLRLGAGAGRDAFRRLAVPVVETEQYAASWEVNLAGSMGALRNGDATLARLFFLRHRRQCRPEAADPGHTRLSICLAWARELQRMGQVSRPGLAFNPHEQLPASALDCLIWASEAAPENADVYTDMARMLAPDSGRDSMRLQILSWLALRAPHDWRLGLELGLVNCRAFRVRQGLEELLGASAAAARQGQAERFSRMLRLRDESGQIRALLAPTLTHAHQGHQEGHGEDA